MTRQLREHASTGCNQVENRPQHNTAEFLTAGMQGIKARWPNHAVRVNTNHWGMRVVKSKAVVVAAFTQEAILKRKIRAHLRKLGFDKGENGELRPPSSSKESVRAVHAEQRKALLRSERRFVQTAYPRLKKYLAEGSEINPATVTPTLELVETGTWQSELFRLASLSWSVPVSRGFGRRLRYLVWDKSNSKLIGIFALGDPVFNLKARDALVGWNAEDRGKRLVNVLDAYVLGAIPPYSLILGGKLVSCLVRSREVKEDFKRRYGDTRGVISKKKKKAQLAIVTTSSSLGRSSVYNRLKLEGETYFRPIGYTQGWGHFHVPDTLFKELRDYLRKRNHKYVDAHQFGQGPNWRLRTIRAAFDALQFKADLLKHGIGREVFICELAQNARKILRGEAVRPNWRSLKTVAEIGAMARDRWLVPRGDRRPEYKNWKLEQFLDLVWIKRSRAMPRDTQDTDISTSSGIRTSG